MTLDHPIMSAHTRILEARASHSLVAYVCFAIYFQFFLQFSYSIRNLKQPIVGLRLCCEEREYVCSHKADWCSSLLSNKISLQVVIFNCEWVRPHQKLPLIFGPAH